MTADAVALLVLRARVERRSDTPLRATIRIADDVRVGFVREIHVAEVEEATELVRRWLDELLKSGP